MEISPAHIEEIKESEHSKRQVSIWLDSYEDLFSDFDPRPYSERSLSDDFIAELKKVCREDEYDIGDLRLLIPKKNQNPADENTITRRLHTYFKQGHSFLSHRLKTTRIRAIFIAFAGMAMILLASYLSGIRSGNYIWKVLFVLFEPAGWFFAWTGLDDLFFSARKRGAEAEFFSKMAITRVHFAGF